jgi:hypothetical protein
MFRYYFILSFNKIDRNQWVSLKNSLKIPIEFIIRSKTKKIKKE